MSEIIFLTGPEPLAVRVAQWLVRSLPSRPWDLSTCAVLVSTMGASRRLRGELAVLAAEAGTGVLPPLVTTPMGLPLAPKNQASPPDCLLAWMKVISASKPEDFPALLGGFSDPRAVTMSVARSLQEVCALLAEAGLSPSSPEVLRACEQDEDRWREITLWHRKYLGILRRAGLADPNESHLRLAEKEVPPPGIERIVVACVPDLNRITQRYLERLPIPVSILVDASGCGEEMRFDSWGRPTAEPLLPLRMEDVEIAADAYSEAEITAAMAEQGGGVCLADERLAPLVRGALARRNIAAFDPQGKPLSRTEPAIVTSGWIAFCDNLLVENLKILLECPVFLQALARETRLSPAGISAAYDQLRMLTLLDYWPDAAACPSLKPDTPEALLAEGVENLRKRFPMDDLRRDLPLFLSHIYHDLPENREVREYAAVLQEVLASPLFPKEPALAAEALRDAAARAVVYEDHAEEAVELNGWLEAAWMPDESLVVAGCAEGILPASITGHAFLPEGVRESLGLATNASRLARDAFLLRNLLASRPPGAVRLVYGRINSEDEPAKPSRLFFHCTDDDLPARVGRLFAGVPSLRAAPAREQGWKLEIPPRPPPEKLRVTGFADYLACPLRFYFKHVLRMEPVEADRVEMDASEYGTLLHRVLEDFANDETARESRSAAEIETFVFERLERRIYARHGRRPSLPVRVQRESLQARLRKFAAVQATEREKGWRILHAELAFRNGEGLPLAGLEITASIDRIEIHEKTGLRRILDYKSFGRDKTPEETHWGRAPQGEILPGEEFEREGKAKFWKNLQLPLYRALARRRWPEDAQPPWIGYFLLPERVEESRIEEFPMDDTLFASAMHCAEAVASRVRSGIFWPPRQPEFDDYAALFPEGNPAGMISEASLRFLKGSGA